MPNDRMTEDYGKLFLAGLEKWERPFGAGDGGAEDLSAGAVAARFLRGVEGWEQPFPAAIQEVVLSPDRSVTALIRPLWLQVKGTIEVIASHAAEEWLGVPVLVERIGAGLVRAARFDARGRLVFSEIAPGEYRVIASPVSGFLGTYGTLLLGAKAGEDSSATVNKEQTFASQGLRASVRLLPHGEIALTFATEDPRLAGGIIRFAFAERQDGRVQLSGAVKLETQPGQLGRWTGYWQYRLEIAQNCELLFSVEAK